MRTAGFRPRTLLAAVVVALLAHTAAAQALLDHGHDGRLHTLRPGEFVVQRQAIPVDVVFIGYERAHIDEKAFLDALPATYSPIVRFPQFYGLNGRDLGLQFHFKYRLVFKGRAFENQFFSFLARTGTDGPLTQFQEQYNAQQKNVLDVTGPVLYIDAPTVERYLGRSRWRRATPLHHLFHQLVRPATTSGSTSTRRPTSRIRTPITTSAIQRPSRKMIAWGGTSSRTWFYDLSAGPESWTNNWIVDDDQTEYHMPPVWEYRAGGYRRPSVLTADLGRVARYVGIDLLFTTSPLYDPLVTAPDVGGSKVAHVAMLEDDPASSGLDFIDANVHEARAAQLPAVLSVEGRAHRHEPGGCRGQALARHLYEHPGGR